MRVGHLGDSAVYGFTPVRLAWHLFFSFKEKYMSNYMGKQPLIYMPNKKNGKGSAEVVYESNIAIRVPTGQFNCNENAKYYPCLLCFNPQLYSNNINGKQLCNVRTGSSYAIELIVIPANSRVDGIYTQGLGNVATGMKWEPIVHTGAWQLAYCWYFKSGVTDIYKIKDSSKSYPYQVGTGFVSLTDTDGQYYNELVQPGLITDIQTALETAGIYSGGFLVCSDTNISDSEILAYHSGVFGNSTGNKTAVVDFDMNSV